MPGESPGARFVRELSQPDDPYSLTVLIIEAGRIADRLAKLDALLSGSVEMWARLTEGRDGALEIRVDSGLQEARQQANVFRQLLAEIHRQRSAGGPPPEQDDVLAGL